MGEAAVYIRRIHIENIGNLGADGFAVDLDLSHEEGQLSGWTVIAGPNGSGKTTLLRAIALVTAGPEVSRFLQESTVGWIREGVASGVVKIELDRGPLDAYYFPSNNFDLTPNREPIPLNLTWRVSSSHGEPIVAADVRQLETGCLHSPHYGPWIQFDQTPGWFIAGYGAYRRLARGSADAQRLTDSSRRPVAQLASLFREDAPFTETVQWLERLHLRRLEGKNGSEQLITSIFGLLNDGLLPGGVRITHVDSDGIWTQQGAFKIPLRRLSDGYQTMAGLVLDILRQLYGAYDQLRMVCVEGVWYVENEGVVLIDEMELHLHPGWQQKVGFWFKKHFPKMQFIVTTHSPFVCQAADPGGIIRLPGPEEARAAYKLEGNAYNAIVNGTVDDAILSELFGLEHTRSSQAEALMDEIVQLEARILDDHATQPEIIRYKKLQNQMPPSTDILRALRRLES